MDFANIAALSVSAISAIVAGYVAFAKLLPERDKISRDADLVAANSADRITETALRLLDETEARLNNRIQTLELELEVERQNRRALQTETEELRNELELERRARNDSTSMLQRLLELERERRAELERGLRILLKQLQALEIEPKWTPASE